MSDVHRGHEVEFAAVTGPSLPTGTPRGPLDPLWKRVVSGQSFGWRYRRLRNRLRTRGRRVARRALGRLKGSPSVRSAGDGVGIRARLTELRERRQRAASAVELRLPVTLPAASGDDRLEPLRSAVRSQPGAPVIPPDVLARLDVATSDPVSYRLGGTWLAALVPHDQPPVGFPQRFEPRTTALTNVDEGALRGRRRRAFVSAARRKRSIDVSVSRMEAVETARLLVELAGAGAVLSADQLPAPVAELVGPDVTAIIEQGARTNLGDALARERHSIALRRVVHMQHTNHGAVLEIARRAGVDTPSRPSITVMMATFRPDAVEFAVQQVSRQDQADLQMLCGLHGFSLPSATRDRLTELVPTIRFVEIDRSHDLGQVLAQLGAQAEGELVVKWDDDDWYGPAHLDDLVTAMRWSGADLVGKAAEFVYLSALDITMRRFATGSESYSTTIGGGTLMLTSRLLRELGGWPSGARRVDRLLIDEVEQHGGRVYRTHGLGYLLRRDSSADRHTWQVADDYFLAQSVDQRPGCDLEFAGVTT